MIIEKSNKNLPEANACNMAEARSQISKLFDLYESGKIDSGLSSKMEIFVSTFYKNVLSEIQAEKYEQFLIFIRTTSGLYNHIVKKFRDNNKYYFIFNLGRIIGSSQISYKVINNLYTEKVGLYIIEKVEDSKDLKDILKLCYTNAKVYNYELCTQFDIKPNNLTKKMKKLLDLELVHRHKVGKNVYYTLTMQGRKLVKQFPVSVTFVQPILKYKYYHAIEDEKQYLTYKTSSFNNAFQPITQTINSNSNGELAYARLY